MSTTTHYTFGRILLQIALGAMLAVSGIWALQGGGDAGILALKDIISAGTIQTVVCITFGVVEIIAGVFLILKLFIGDKFGVFGKVILIIILVVWAAAIILIDFVGNGGIINHAGRFNFLSWLYSFSYHLIVLGAIIYLND
ncbi:MAG: hypothetical protein K5829_15350 [Treponema sp.]|nr:hypothetical protein [Treponema sp.]